MKLPAFKIRVLFVWGLILTLGSLDPLFAKSKAKAVAPPLQRGATVRLNRNETLRFLGKPFREAQSGEIFEVLEVRAEAGQVFVGERSEGRTIALSLPVEAVIPMAKDSLERAKLVNALFAGPVVRLNLRIEPTGMELLRKEPRNYTEVSIEEVGTKTYGHVALKLKGSAGSFQAIDAKPGFSLNFDKYKGSERFHGLKRFQLNNCAQDGTALNELIAGQLARSAGVPASRCTHAIVSLNGRDLGIYVLKEGFSEDFLSAFFARTDGNLYDGGFVAEIREEMELDHGDPEHKEPLKRLVGALGETDATRQFERLNAVLDVDAYLRYLFLENILCHWDGYSFNRNNYRLYEDPATGRFHFILHGMDQVFSDPNWNVQREPAVPLGAILWRRPEVRARYQALATEVYSKAIKPVNWPARVEAAGNRLLAALQAINPDQAKGYQPRVTEAKDRINARLNAVRLQIEGNTLLNTLSASGSTSLADADWSAKTENAEANEVTEEGRICMHLKATGEANGSWRLNLTVPAGKYRIEASLKGRGIVPLQTSAGEGVGIRISGATRPADRALTGDIAWKHCTYDFESTGSAVSVVLELRAKGGDLWIDRKSLKLTKLH